MAKDDSPIPPEALNKFVQDVFTPLKKGQCVTSLWVPGAGKRFRINYLLSEQNILKKFFGPSFNQIIFIHIHPEDIIDLSNLGYLQIIYDKLQLEIETRQLSYPGSKSTNPLINIQGMLKFLLARNYEVIFLFNGIELLSNFSSNIYFNLEAIHTPDKKKIRFLFLSNKNIIDESYLLPMGNLRYAVSRNIVYIPLYSGEQIDYLIDYTCSYYNAKLTPAIEAEIKEYFGGHSLLIKYGFSFFANIPKQYWNDWNYLTQYFESNVELIIAVKEIWNSLNNLEKDIIKQVIQTGILSEKFKKHSKYLLETGIINITSSGQANTFGKFFNHVILSELPSYELAQDKITKEIVLNSLPIMDEFTAQEYAVLKLLLNDKNKVTSREQIAKTLWGKDYSDKYSDWAIDKVISIVRKKLGNLGFPPKNLITLKKRGFKLVPN